MDKVRLFLDVDDVVYDTTRYLQEITGCKEDVYDYFQAEGRSLTGMSNLLDYEKIPKRVSDDEVRRLSETFDVVFCSEYFTKREIIQKRDMLYELFNLDTIGVNRAMSRKYFIPMNGSILVDDNIMIIDRSSASSKVCMYNGNEEEINKFIGYTVKDFESIIWLYKNGFIGI